MLKNSKKDIAIWCSIILLIVSSITCFYYFSDYLLLTRILSLLFAFMVSLFLFVNTNIGSFFWNFAKESIKEIDYITWPSTKETMQTTLIILTIVLFMGIILCIIDIFFFNLIKWVANFG